MTTPLYTERLNAARAAVARLTMSDQLSLLADFFGGGICRQSEAFADALYPVSKAFDAAYDEADAAAEPSPYPTDLDGDWMHRDTNAALLGGYRA